MEPIDARQRPGQGHKADPRLAQVEAQGLEHQIRGKSTATTRNMPTREQES